MAVLGARFSAMLFVVMLAVVSASHGALAAARGAKRLYHVADEIARPSSAGAESATLPSGLPDNDHLRRRLFFIGGDLVDLGDSADSVRRQPSRLLQPPSEGAAAAAVGQPQHGAPAANHAATADLAGEVAPVHEKDADDEAPRRAPRPGHRDRADRDQEIRAAMENSDVFQGPPAEADEAADGAEPKKTATAVRRGTYRWSVVDTDA